MILTLRRIVLYSPSVSLDESVTNASISIPFSISARRDRAGGCIVQRAAAAGHDNGIADSRRSIQSGSAD
jgi:hypothetical protein